MEFTLVIILLDFLAGPCLSLPGQISSHPVVGERRQRRNHSDYIEENTSTAMDKIIHANDRQGVISVDGTNLREGDIAVSGRSQKKCFARSCLWTKFVDGKVYIAYSLSHAYSEEDVKNIKKGMKLIEEDTCVRFVPRTYQRDYLDIQPKTGCWSYLGARGGRQTISLQTPECTGSGVTVHELMHALGFVHEQSRADRDKYVTIMWSNIWKDRLRNFEKFKTNNLDTPYDYGSIMHFGKYAFSEDGEPTIVPKRNWNVKFGQRFGPSDLDIMKINNMYKCNV
ncbi:high choriolytic enzyme 1-like [Carassius auratus]|uniref:Metalloendopeptidase n=1 Tax=Carassius auratus TaxID=7957 RepID=A0A6P6KRB6_CARAU|nr:high choriolytic enzyme 1-like [Carassius auratus]XP_052461703.1 hatching enzyme 1.2-like [Carassius gibelio]